MRSILATSAFRRLGIALLVGVAVAAAYPSIWADPAPPTSKDRNIALTFTLMLGREHLTRHPFDKEIYSRTVTQFVKALDPNKVYFYQSDVDGFNARQAEVGKVAKHGDVSFAHEIFRVFLARVDERMKVVDQLLSAPHDFNADEKYVVDRDAAQFPQNEAEALDRWRQRIKYDLLVQKADKLEKEKKKAAKKETDKDAKAGDGETAVQESSSDEDPIGKLRRRYHTFAKRMHQVDSEELLEMYLTSLSSSFDPHTSYMSPSTVDNFDIQMGLKLEGIGAALQLVDGYTTVQKIIPGGPAEKDKRLKVGDRITGVGQNAEGPVEDVVEMKLNDVVKKIRGREGSVVRLEVMPAHSTQRKILQLTRAKIELKDSEARFKIFEEGRRADGRPYKIGVIDLPSFYMDMAAARAGRRDFKSTTRDVRKILEDFNRQGVDALLLDLRRNGGGSLQEAINLTALFTGSGPVVQVKDSDGQVRSYSDHDGTMVWKGPMVVLISKFSASASEILAGAVQDYHRGLVIGDRATHGKGTVQSLMDLGETLFRNPFSSKQYGSLKVTMQQFYRPNGDSTQQRGVLSDVELPSLTTHLDVGEGDLDYPIPFDRIQAAEFHPYSYVTQALLQQLKQRSVERCTKSSDFGKTRRDIAHYEQQKQRKWVPLQERKFLEERAELNADREEEKKIEEMDAASTDIKKDFYLSEALAVTTDYVSMLGHAPAPQAAQAGVSAQER